MMYYLATTIVAVLPLLWWCRYEVLQRSGLEREKEGKLLMQIMLMWTKLR